jgi:hypothetical protein
MEDMGSQAAVPVSVPSVAHVIMRSVGEYSDRTVSAVCALFDEDAAKRFVVVAERQWRNAVATYPPIKWPDNYNDDVVFNQFQEETFARLTAVKEMLTLDPDSAPDECGDDQPFYYYHTIPILTSAIEAEGGDPQGLRAQHESAMPQADAQDQPHD